MADESHLSVLKQGVEAWNKWRDSEGQRGLLDLSGADLSLVDLSLAHLSDANLRGADLSEANLGGANLSGAKLSGAKLCKADLSGAKLSEAKLWKADLSNANLGGAVLNRVNLREANLSEADLRRADLSKADLGQANLREANLSEANLTGATLRRTLLDRTNFERATVGGTIFGAVDLSSCRGLESVRHRAPSTLGVDSIIRSKGRIPKIFLREVGLPDDWIRQIPSLAGASTLFFSCFISYSSLDKLFADRLYDALQSMGIRCWRDEKELVPGQDISRELERGIDSYDKFLLCASRNSLTSWWVEDEIKTALEIERAVRKERGKPVFKLIPLDLDGYMFTTQWDLGVQAKGIRSRVAADFRDWQNDDAKFNHQVNRVIKALRADEGALEPPPPPKL